MSLAPDERRTLTQIENALGRSDPWLAALFTRFSAEAGRSCPLLMPRLRSSPRLIRARVILLVAVAVILLIACAAVAVVAASRPAPRGGHRPGVGQIMTYPAGRLLSSRVTRSSSFSASARLYSSARWAAVRSSTSLSPLSVRYSRTTRASLSSC
jgi:hypothetical protein